MIGSFEKPKVFALSNPIFHMNIAKQFLSENGLSWFTDANDADLLVEFAGRICYVSFGADQGRFSNREYIKNLLEKGHGSVLEHASFSFLVTQVTRGFTHQMVRHRAGFSYSQESTHFIDYTKKLKIRELNLDNQIEEHEILEHLIKESQAVLLDLYSEGVHQLMDAGHTKKQACGKMREMLPIGMESKIVITGNLRSLRHFLEIRGNKNNTEEIRSVALQILETLKIYAPNCVQDMQIIEGEIQSKYKKV